MLNKLDLCIVVRFGVFALLAAEVAGMAPSFWKNKKEQQTFHQATDQAADGNFG